MNKDNNTDTDTNKVISLSNSKTASNQAMEAIKVGWGTFKERPWWSIGIMLITQVATMTVAALVEFLSGGAYVIGSILSQLFSVFLGMTMLVLFFNMYDKKELKVSRVLSTGKMFLNYIAVSILVSLAVLVGLVLLIVPGIIVMFKLMFAPQLVVDRNLGPIDAMKKSWEMTKGNMSYIVSVSLLLIGVMLLGVLALVLGLLVAIPVAMYASIHAYRTVLKANE